jgi:ABC-type branched-subunit amino acid transport system ATPase component
MGATSPRLTGVRAHARGLGRAFQLTQLFPNLTVLENVRLAVQATRDGTRAGASEPVERLERPRLR